jgi:hypothetical protein
MAHSHVIHEGRMAEVSQSVHTALLLSILLTEVRRAMAYRADAPAREEPADMPSVVALANLAARLNQAPPSPAMSVRHKQRDASTIHEEVMRLAGSVASLLDADLGAPSFAAATFRVAELDGAADSIEGLLYAALTCLHVCLLGAQHARNSEVYMLLLALVVYPGLEPLHPASLGALGDTSRRSVAPLVLSLMQSCLQLMLSHKREPELMKDCIRRCADCRGVLAVQLHKLPRTADKPIPEVLRALEARTTATLDMLHHFSEL